MQLLYGISQPPPVIDTVTMSQNFPFLLIDKAYLGKARRLAYGRIVEMRAKVHLGNRRRIQQHGCNHFRIFLHISVRSV